MSESVGWVSILRPEVIQELLAIPADVAVVGYLCLGFPTEFPGRPMLETAGWLPRLPLASTVFANRWNAEPSAELARVLNVVDDEAARRRKPL